MRGKRIKLGDCLYFPVRNMIVRPDGSEHKLTSKPAEILRLLYENSDRRYTLSQLQEAVWQGKTIQENTVHRAISRVREAFDESPNNVYIENLRTEGYQFVATVKTVPVIDVGVLGWPITIAALILLIYNLYLFPSPPNKPEILTTLIGQEANGTYAQNLLIFSHKRQDETYWNLYAKRIGQDRYFRLTNGEYNDQRPVFSPDNKKIAYQRHDGEKCLIMISDVEDSLLPFSNEQVAYHCLDELLSVSISWKDNDNLYLSMKKSLLLPYQVYLLNLKTQQLDAISHPPASIQGDYFISYSQTAQKLVYLRWEGDSHTEIWIYDPEKETSSKLATMPVLLLQAAWVDEGKKLVVRTETKKFGTIDISNGKVDIILDANYPIRYPFSIDKNTVGYVRGREHVDDILQMGLDGSVKVVISSSFHDYMPAYSQEEEITAFVSTRSGRPQIWILDKNGDTRQITQFDTSFRIGSLAISNDGRLLAYTVNTQIHLIDLNGKIIFSSDDNEVYKNPVFSEDGKTLYYAINYQDSWRIESRTINNLDAPIQLFEGLIVKPCTHSKCLFVIRFNDPKLYKWEKGIFSDTNVELGNIQNPSQFTVFENLVYYIISTKDEATLKRYDLLTGKTEILLNMPSKYFTFNRKKSLVYTSNRHESETMLEKFQMTNH